MFLASWIENDNAAFSENLYISYMESFKNNNFFRIGVEKNKALSEGRQIT